METKNAIKPVNLQWYWKISAFLFPLCAMYGPFVPDEGNPKSGIYWRFILAGLAFYLLSALALSLLL